MENMIAGLSETIVRLTVLCAAAAASAQEPLQDARYYLDQLNNYYQSIKTISAEYSLSARDGNGEEINVTRRCFIKGPSYREESRRFGSTVEVFHENKRSTLTRYADSSVNPQLKIEAIAYHNAFLESRRVLFSGIGFFDRAALDPELFDRFNASVSYFTESDGRRTIQVRLESPSDSGRPGLVFRLDQENNFVPVFYGGDNFSTEIISFQDVDGYRIPREIRTTNKTTGEDASQTEQVMAFNVSNVEVNRPIDDSIFEIVPERGTLVVDNIANVTYTVGEETAGVADTFVDGQAPSVTTTAQPAGSADKAAAAQAAESEQGTESAAGWHPLAPTAALAFAFVAMVFLIASRVAAPHLRKWRKNRS